MSQQRDDGGPAFPRALPKGEFPPADVLRIIQQHAGMTLRDYFAGKAMESMVGALSTLGAFTNAMTREAADCELSIEDYLAARAYDWADAMLKARQS